MSYGQGDEIRDLKAEIARLREELDAGLMYGENGVYWHARCQAAHLREAEKDKELARLREALENIAYHPSAACRGVRDWTWEANSMRNIAKGALRG